MKKLIFLFGVVPLMLHAQIFTGRSEMRDNIAQYQADVSSLTRKYDIKESEEYYTRFNKFYGDWQKKLMSIQFDNMSQDGKVDYVLLRNAIDKDIHSLKENKKEFDQIQSTIPYASKIMSLVQQRRNGVQLNAEETAKVFTDIRKELQTSQKGIEN